MAETQLVKVGEQKTYSSAYLIGALILGLAIGTLLSFVWFKTEKPSGATTSETSKSTTAGDIVTSTSTATSSVTSDQSQTIQNSGGVLAIEDQPAGLSVTITQAQVSSDQWVVIREAKNGQPSNVLGAARFVGGATTGSVELLRTTVAGATYYGVVYKDNGDRMFSLTDDTPVLDASGNPILVSFTAR